MCRVSKKYLDLFYQTKRNMKTISTNDLRADVNNGYCFVRNLQGTGVVDALVPEKKEKEVYEVIEKNKHLGFTAVWQALINVKGVSFNYQSN